MAFQGLEKVSIPSASAGDIVSVAGFDDVSIGESPNRQSVPRLRRVMNRVGVGYIDVIRSEIFSLNVTGRNNEQPTHRLIAIDVPKFLRRRVELPSGAQRVDCSRPRCRTSRSATVG